LIFGRESYYRLRQIECRKPGNNFFRVLRVLFSVAGFLFFGCGFAAPGEFVAKLSICLSIVYIAGMSTYE